jgi:hypothetical protein
MLKCATKSRRVNLWIVTALGLLSASHGTATGQTYSGERLIDAAAYRERIRGMWLGECIANWTGLQTEGRHRDPPFLTDASWGQVQPYSNGFPLEYKWFFNPWWADDDTDIEYVYLHLLSTQNTLFLTPQQIADGWIRHINRFIWVSNARARALMTRGVVPPGTGLACANEHRLEIDAQLTTEIFGTLAPGDPGRAMDLADLPIRTSAAGYAAHASQFFVVLYSLAPQIPASVAPGRDRSLWLVTEGRKFIPDGSRAAEVIDFVKAEYLNNPDVTNWELTRDRMWERYKLNPGANGWVYRDWYESVINLGTGVLALLYGEGDYRQTVKIGTLSGWDSDNGTATMGGLLGLANGYDWVRAQFNNGPRENFWITRTRDDLPDYTPPGDGFEDTFAMMADRWMPLVKRNIRETGGLVDDQHNRFLLPPATYINPLAASPTWRDDSRSANNAVRRAGGTITATFSGGTGTGTPPAARGVATVVNISNGLETRFDGLEEDDTTRAYFSSQGRGAAADGMVTLEVTYDRPIQVHTVRFIEGDHFTDATSNGGWLTSLRFEAHISGNWTPLTGTLSSPQLTTRPFEVLDFIVTSPIMATGVRLIGTAGGTGQFVTCAELDILSAPLTIPRATFDINQSGSLTIDDLYAWEANPHDLTGDNISNAQDRAYLTRAIRWVETQSLLAER